MLKDGCTPAVLESRFRPGIKTVTQLPAVRPWYLSDAPPPDHDVKKQVYEISLYQSGIPLRREADDGEAWCAYDDEVDDETTDSPASRQSQLLSQRRNASRGRLPAR